MFKLLTSKPIWEVTNSNKIKYSVLVLCLYLLVLPKRCNSEFNEVTGEDRCEKGTLIRANHRKCLGGSNLEDHPMTCKRLITMVTLSPNWGYSVSKWPKWLVNEAY